MIPMDLTKAGDSGPKSDDSQVAVGATIALNRVPSEPSIIVISIRGDVDKKDTRLLSSLAVPMQTCGYDNVVLDLNETGWFPDGGFGAFASVLKSAMQRNGKVALCRASPEMKAKLKMFGFEQFFPVFESRQEAIDYLRNDDCNEDPSAEA